MDIYVHQRFPIDWHRSGLLVTTQQQFILTTEFGSAALEMNQSEGDAEGWADARPGKGRVLYLVDLLGSTQDPWALISFILEGGTAPRIVLRYIGVRSQEEQDEALLGAQVLLIYLRKMSEILGDNGVLYAAPRSGAQTLLFEILGFRQALVGPGAVAQWLWVRPPPENLE